MKSTLIQPLQNESGVMPLKYRRDWLPLKYILKNHQISNNPSINSIELLRLKIQRGSQYWNNKIKPSILQAYNFADVNFYRYENQLVPIY